ncbi:MAG: N-acetylneuraminate synthase [Desulfobacter postgatei]|uniref:N-acetylneuraminate synthase n=1 Tax=Desulfobacter postgatei TaxID=2293 RepID=A0A2G6MRT5_9BACT|nr:MAG: N-acetylneuraminate synthase [Desulfobacter postgatei]
MKLGKFEIGKPAFIVAEIGINHNGDIEIARKLIAKAKDSGCNAVKFQKRTIDVVYSSEELAMHRETPFGSTNGDLKRGLEFSFKDYQKIDQYCKQLDLIWFASPWDEASVDFLESFNVPCHKVAAAGLTDAGLLKKIKSTGKPVLLSTGMSELDEIDKAVNILGTDNLLLFHCVSLYPAPPDKVNLRAISTLGERYNIPIGYSGHELDTVISAAAVAMGAVAVERHFTLDRNMWGSDHKASIMPFEMAEMVKNIRLIEQAFGTSEIHCLPEEIPVKQKLRRVDSI